MNPENIEMYCPAGLYVYIMAQTMQEIETLRLVVGL